MQPKPRLWDGFKQRSEKQIWSYQGPECDHYQREHNLLFDAIRNDKPYNETERCAKACLVAIMGRMACESGQAITFEDAMASTKELAPGLEKITSLDSPAPVTPDANGRYPIAMPGQTEVL
jgi:myo-inositol 2-dehydrogenase / D-chiro-inositol 1-dehydrogenase